jgi:hypothetical protein
LDVIATYGHRIVVGLPAESDQFLAGFVRSAEQLRDVIGVKRPTQKVRIQVDYPDHRSS